MKSKQISDLKSYVTTI